MMRYGLLDYSLVGGKFNIGDYVQSLAARQFLPRVDEYINREELCFHKGDETKIILNGWFMHEPENWPPSPSVKALPVSFHMTRPYVERILTKRGVEYFKEFSEVGCRDFYTAQVLSDRGVNAYYSGCLTTTLKRPNVERKKKILFVDVLHAAPDLKEYKRMPMRYFLSHIRSGNIWLSLKKKNIEKKLIESLKGYEDYEVGFIQNSIDGNGLSSEERFFMAQKYLEELASAHLVVTSRIHCALPCLAYDTPVVFVKYGQKSLSNTYRFRGIIDHMNVLDLDGDLSTKGYESRKIDIEDLSDFGSLSNPKSYIGLAKNLEEKCRGFILER